MILFLDYDGVVNSVIWEYREADGKFIARYSGPRDNKVNNYQAVQWISELCQKFSIDIVVTSTWRKSDNYKDCLVNGGLRNGINIRGRLPLDDYRKTRAELINEYLEENWFIGDQFIIVDDEVVDMSPYGYCNEEHFVRCLTNSSFQLEEFGVACELVSKLTEGNN